MATGPSVELTGSVAGVRGRRLACGPGGRWASAERRLVMLDGGALVTAPRPLDGALRFAAGGAELLAGSERLELSTGAFAALADPRPAVADGAGELEVIAASWDAAGETLAVSAQRRAGARVPGPRAWLTLLDGRARTPLRSLWAGISEPPRQVALEGGVLAADVDARARVWSGEEELAPDAGPVGALALGDGGRVLALIGFDGEVTVWRGPEFDRGEHAGDGSRQALAAAADAPVLAWARAHDVVVWAGGETTALPVPGVQALALDAAGTRLVALDAGGTLHDAAIAR